MNNCILKGIVGLFLISTPISLIAQDNFHLDEINGTFTVYVKSLKEKEDNFSEEELFEIESLRKETKDFETSIDGFKVLIMSREKMEANLRWPKYSLLNK